MPQWNGPWRCWYSGDDYPQPAIAHMAEQHHSRSRAPSAGFAFYRRENMDAYDCQLCGIRFIKGPPSILLAACRRAAGKCAWCAGDIDSVAKACWDCKAPVEP